MNNKNRYPFTEKLGELVSGLGDFFTHIGRAAAPYLLVLVGMIMAAFSAIGAGKEIGVDPTTAAGVAAFVCVGLYLSWAGMSGATQTFDRIVYGFFFAVTVILSSFLTILFFGRVSLSPGLVQVARSLYSFTLPLLTVMGLLSVALVLGIHDKAKPTTPDQTIAYLAGPAVGILVVLYSATSNLAFGISHGVPEVTAVAACITAELTMVASFSTLGMQLEEHSRKGGDLDIFDAGLRAIFGIVSAAYIGLIAVAENASGSVSGSILSQILLFYGFAPIVFGFSSIAVLTLPRLINITSRQLVVDDNTIGRAVIAGGLCYLGWQTSLILAVVGLATGWAFGYRTIKAALQIVRTAADRRSGEAPRSFSAPASRPPLSKPSSAPSFQARSIPPRREDVASFIASLDEDPKG